MKGPAIFLAQFLGDEPPFNTLDGILQAPPRVPGEVSDLVGIKLRKQGGREVGGKARMSLVEEQGAIDQTFRTN